MNRNIFLAVCVAWIAAIAISAAEGLNSKTRLPHVSRRTRRVLGPLDSLVVDG